MTLIVAFRPRCGISASEVTVLERGQDNPWPPSCCPISFSRCLCWESSGDTGPQDRRQTVLSRPAFMEAVFEMCQLPLSWYPHLQCTHECVSKNSTFVCERDEGAGVLKQTVGFAFRLTIFNFFSIFFISSGRVYKCHAAHVAVTRQLEGASSLLLTCGFWGSSSGCQAWRQASAFVTEPSCHLSSQFDWPSYSCKMAARD